MHLLTSECVFTVLGEPETDKRDSSMTSSLGSDPEGCVLVELLHGLAFRAYLQGAFVYFCFFLASVVS